MQPVSCNTQTAYKWGEGGVGWPLVDTDGLNVALAQGKALHIPPGTDHAITNESSNEIQFLVISAPSTRSDRHEIVVKK